MAVVTPPNVVTPSFEGKCPGPFNMFGAIIGRSGDGKGLATGVAASLVPDLRGAATTIPVSGEGLPTLFSVREPEDGGDADAGDEGKGRTVLKCVNTRAFLNVPEVSVLGAAMNRLGSTLTGSLASVWSGETLGGQNVNPAKRLKAVAYGYRVGMIVGVQPGNADALTGEDTTGIPQRILWATTLDLDAPKVRPEEPAGEFGFDAAKLKGYEPTPFNLSGLYKSGDYWSYRNSDTGKPLYPLHHLTYPQCVYDAMDPDAYDRLHGTRPDGMDGHALFSMARTAGVLAIMEQREGMELTVTEDDWARAEYIAKRSREFREQCMNAGRRERRGKRRDALADELVAKDEAQEIAEREKAERDYRRYAKRVENALTKHDAKREGMAGYMVQKKTGISTADTYRTIERMYTENMLDKIGPDLGEGHTASQLWALVSAPTPSV
ncbi:hypothetical protein [Bifidobacterium avesanii]|uniref:hypothetical protein n=1 Tax=Bifidobacterium avesanii TaxID=1798157 RepID=UPI00126677BE|nr:hypothetical protein [Bifidobacterium avesanii]